MPAPGLVGPEVFESGAPLAGLVASGRLVSIKGQGVVRPRERSGMSIGEMG